MLFPWPGPSARNAAKKRNPSASPLSPMSPTTHRPPPRPAKIPLRAMSRRRALRRPRSRRRPRALNPPLPPTRPLPPFHRTASHPPARIPLPALNPPPSPRKAAANPPRTAVPAAASQTPPAPAVPSSRACKGAVIHLPSLLMDYFNPAAITDENGVVEERYAFSAFGVRSVMFPDWSAKSTSDFAFEFGFQGQLLDTESGLYNYGYRYYSTYLGRWPSKDPIEERGGINLYSMCENDASNLIDKLGTQTAYPIPSAAAPSGAIQCCNMSSAMRANTSYGNAITKGLADCTSQGAKDGASCCVISYTYLAKLCIIYPGGGRLYRGQSCASVKARGNISAPNSNLSFEYRNW